MRLIDAEALRKELESFKDGRSDHILVVQGYEIDKCIKALDYAPTIDTDYVPLIQDIIATFPDILDKAVKLYIEERRRE